MNESLLIGYEVKTLQNELAAVHADFTAAVDEIDTAQRDTLLDEKLGRIDTELTNVKARMDKLLRAAQRPQIGRQALPAADGYKTQFIDGYIRGGVLPEVQTKALDITVPGEGGYALPLQIDQQIEARLRTISPIREVANVVQVSTANYSKLVASSGLSSGWVAEQDARPVTTTTTFTQISPPYGDLYANPSATQFMLDDAVFNVEQWLAEEIARDFAQKEGTAFVNGTGTSQPKGFLTYPNATSTDATRPVGTLQYQATGVAGGFSTTVPAEQLIDLLHSLRAPYRQGAVWIMNSKTLSVIRKIKDSVGHFIWQPTFAEGRAATLLGYPVMEAEDMPDIATNSLSIAFGNFNHGYVIADRIGTRILRDPYSNKPYVQFYATKRVGGALANSEAIKLLKFGVS